MMDIWKLTGKLGSADLPGQWLIATEVVRPLYRGAISAPGV
jgi:hypothetical protein